MSGKFTLKMNIPKVIRTIEDGAAKRMLIAVNEVRNVTLETLSGPRTLRRKKSGKPLRYYVPGTHRLYTPSAPGEAPAQATSGLRQSVKQKVEVLGHVIIGTVGTDLRYGKRLEKGTRYMAARPWLRKSFDKAKGRVKAILSGRWL